MYGVYVIQRGQAYYLFTPQGEQIGLLFMGYDGQYMKDLAALKPIAKAMGARWGIKSAKETD